MVHYMKTTFEFILSVEIEDEKVSVEIIDFEDDFQESPVTYDGPLNISMSTSEYVTSSTWTGPEDIWYITET